VENTPPTLDSLYALQLLDAARRADIYEGTHADTLAGTAAMLDLSRARSALKMMVLSSPSLTWADSPGNALLVDPFPNPKRFAIAKFGPIEIAIDCGAPGVHVGK